MACQIPYATNTCLDHCCIFYVRPYPVNSLQPNQPRQNHSRICKAGSFVYDSLREKVLLVQSRGQMWGPPKGRINPLESTLDCAIREVREETGLELPITNLVRTFVVRSKSLFYLMDIEECKVELQSDLNDNDANGIGWFHVNCLQKLVRTGELMITQSCRMLIQRIFNVTIDYNRETLFSKSHRIAQKEQDD